MATPAELNEQLKWKTRAVELMREMDRLRDEARDEHELTAGIMSTLTRTAEAELGLLWLRDEDAPEGAAEGELQLRTVVDRAQVYDEASAGALAALAAKAAAMEGAHFVTADLPLHDRLTTYCLAMPLRVGAESLGALLLLNADRPFDGPERELVQHAVSQIDTALQHARVLRDLQRQKTAIETVFRIDRVRDSQPDFQAMLDTVLAEVCQSIAAETGFIMLYDQTGQELELRATTGQGLFIADDAARAIRMVANEALAAAQLVSCAYANGVVRAVVAVPLILRDKLIGVLGVVNRKGRPAFSRSDVQLLRAIASQIDTAIFESLQSQRLRNAFGQSVGPQVMERLLNISDRDLLSGERIIVTSLFSDIRGFTQMSQRLDPDVLQAVLNDHLSALTDLVLRYEGTLDKYIGDCVMCFFNAPERQPDHAVRAVRLALDMMRAHHAVMERWRGQLALPPIGIGISTGETMVGNFGSVKRLEYTVIGHDVNLAARLCGAAEADQILISQSTYDLVREVIIADEMPWMHLKGIEGDVRCWAVSRLVS